MVKRMKNEETCFPKFRDNRLNCEASPVVPSRRCVRRQIKKKKKNDVATIAGSLVSATDAATRIARVSLRKYPTKDGGLTRRERGVGKNTEENQGG